MALVPIREAARGRWRSILPHFGLSQRNLSGKSGPCPICRDGTDRFTFDDKEQRGTWVCRKCETGGDGVALVMRVRGLTFREAARQIEEVAGLAPVDRPKLQQTAEQQRQAVVALWKATNAVQAGDPVDTYLRQRLGTVAIPTTIRLHPHCRYQDDVVSYHPAMVARITSPDGITVSAHRTYLTADGRKASVPQTRRNMPGSIPDGSAVRLMASAPTMGVAEGIETAFAASKLFGMPVWAALNAAMLTKWVPPVTATRIIVFGDNDAQWVGQTAACALAKRLCNLGLVAEVKWPDAVDTDWNDVLLAQGLETRAA